MRNLGCERSVFLLIAFSVKVAMTAKILLVPAETHSHIDMQLGTGQELDRLGHSVYMAIADRFPRLETIKKARVKPLTYRYPPDDMYAFSEEAERAYSVMIFSPVDETQSGETMKGAPMVSALVNRACEYMLSDNVFLDTAKKLNFDLAVAEPFFVCPCVMALPHVLGVPFISMTGFQFPWTFRVPALPSTVFLTGPQKTNLNPESFAERLQNAAAFLLTKLVVMPALWNNTLLQKYAPEVSSWDDLISRSELFVLQNDHHLFSAWPLFPNVITCPGLTVKPAKPLAADFEKIFAEASDGVILASFGTTAYYLPTDVTAKFLEAFSRLKQTVFARFAVPDGMKVPGNVRMLPWLPQNDIFGHPKMRLFITHCGTNGQYEALYHGVPMLGFPMFGDQPTNCHRAYLKGFGLEMDIDNFTSTEMYENIEELLNNSTYRTAIRKLSEIWRDEPMMFGSQKAAFWINHVIKYGGAHLRSPAADMPLYRVFMLDVLGLVLVLIIVVVILLIFAFRWILKKCRNALKCDADSGVKKTQ